MIKWFYGAFAVALFAAALPAMAEEPLVPPDLPAPLFVTITDDEDSRSFSPSEIEGRAYLASVLSVGGTRIQLSPIAEGARVMYRIQSAYYVLGENELSVPDFSRHVPSAAWQDGAATMTFTADQLDTVPFDVIEQLQDAGLHQDDTVYPVRLELRILSPDGDVRNVTIPIHIGC